MTKFDKDLSKTETRKRLYPNLTWNMFGKILATVFREANDAVPRLPVAWLLSHVFIMLDEPFAGVDPIAVQDIQDIVWRLKDKNIGILITDHNVDETLQITDRAYLLFEGKILFQGTSQELADQSGGS